jgi:hypothetical protein
MRLTQIRTSYMIVSGPRRNSHTVGAGVLALAHACCKLASFLPGRATRGCRRAIGKILYHFVILILVSVRLLYCLGWEINRLLRPPLGQQTIFARPRALGCPRCMHLFGTAFLHQMRSYCFMAGPRAVQQQFMPWLQQQHCKAVDTKGPTSAAGLVVPDVAAWTGNVRQHVHVSPLLHCIVMSLCLPCPRPASFPERHDCLPSRLAHTRVVACAGRSRTRIRLAAPSAAQLGKCSITAQATSTCASQCIACQAQPRAAHPIARSKQ